MSELVEARNREALEGWSKKCLWGMEFDCPTEEERTRRLTAVVKHVVRRLSRGFVPSSDAVLGTLSGEVPLQRCGVIGCPVETEHVH